MPIPGAQYQDLRWKEAKRLLQQCGVSTLISSQPSEPLLFSRLSRMLDGTTAEEASAAALTELVPDWRGRLLQCLARLCQRKSQYTDEIYELAADLALLLFLKPQQLQRLFRDLVAKLMTIPPTERQPQAFGGWLYRACGNLLSELRYEADAQNYAAATGRQCGVTHIRKLAKLEELNRAVETLFENRNLSALAPLLGVPEHSLIGDELALRRAKRREHRAALILALGGHILAQNRYGNLRNPDKVEDCLRELEGIVLVHLPDESRLADGTGDWASEPWEERDLALNRGADLADRAGDEYAPLDPGTDLDGAGSWSPRHRPMADSGWMLDLLGAIQVDSPAGDSTHHHPGVFDSPRISETGAGPEQAAGPTFQDLAYGVFRELPRPVYLGLFFKWGRCDALPEEHLDLFPKRTCTWAHLARLAGRTQYHLRQEVEQAEARLRALRVVGDQQS